MLRPGLGLVQTCVLMALTLGFVLFPKPKHKDHYSRISCINRCEKTAEPTDSDYAFGQSMELCQSVGIGENEFTPSLSAILELSSDTRGTLIPRLTSDQHDRIKSPSTGLLVYQTDVNAGFYYYNGSQQQRISARAPEGLLPIANNNQESGRKLDRRVELTWF